MSVRHSCAILLLTILLLSQFDFQHCGRVGGRGRISTGSRARPSQSRRAPTYHPSPSYPSPSYPSPSRPAPAPSSNIGWNIPSPGSRPAPSKPAPSNYGWGTNTQSHPSPSQPSRPSPSNYGWNVPSSPSRPSPSIPSSPSRPSPSFPSSPSRPSPSIPGSPSRPAAPSNLPAPNYGWKQDIMKKPSAPQSPSTPSKTSNPWGIPGRQSPYDTKQTAHNTQSSPNAPPSYGTAGWNPNVNKQVNSGAQRPVGSNTGGVADQANKKNVGQQQNTYPQGPAKYPQQQYSPGYSQNYQPGYRPGSYGYNPGGGHTTIINNNNYHQSNYGGYGGYGGGFGYHAPPVFYPSYSYSYRDTGSTTLGFFLGYSLARLTTPSYYYYGHRHDSYRPVYDHYTVHHYYHNNQDVPKQEKVESNAIVVCVGDSGKVCPPNNYALCTTSGSIMCVASAAATVPCKDIAQANCVQSTVPCLNNTTPECKDKKPEDTTTVSIPCIYNTKVMGDITYVNNTIVLEEQLRTLNETIANLTAVIENRLDVNNNNNNLTVISMNANDTNSNGTNNTDAPMTTTPSSGNTEEAPVAPRTKRDTPQEQQFCVTIVAEPAERKNLTENEIFFQGAKTIFEKFSVKALGADRV